MQYNTFLQTNVKVWKVNDAELLISFISFIMHHHIAVNIYLQSHRDFHPQFNVCAEKMTQLSVDDFVPFFSGNFPHGTDGIVN